MFFVTYHGGGDFNNIYAYDQSGTQVNSISHPFAMAFDDQNHCFVSNQDTNLVTQLNLNAPPTTATAVKGAAASYLKQFDKNGTFLDGTFVASACGCLPHIPATTPVPINRGRLDVVILSGKVQNSVRDIVLAGPGTPPSPLLLYVLDEPGNLIRLYDPVTGVPCGISNQVGIACSGRHPPGSRIAIWSPPVIAPRISNGRPIGQP
jgi:hypothetical protein